MGFFDAIASVVGTGADVAMQAATNAQNYKMFHEQQTYNTSEREAAQDYNTAERQAAQAYNTSEREAAQAYNTSEREATQRWNEMMYNQYSSPQAKAAAYAAAGLNPRLAVEGQGLGVAGSSPASVGGASVSPGSSPGGTSVNPPYSAINYNGNFTAGFQDMASALSAIAQAKKAGAETKEIETLLNEKLKQYQNSNDAQEFLNMLNKKHLEKKMLAEIDDLAQKISTGSAQEAEFRAAADKLVKEGVLTQYQVDTFWEKYYTDKAKTESETHVNETQANLNEVKAVYTKAQTYLTQLMAKTEKTNPELNEALTKMYKALTRGYDIANDIDGVLSQDRKEYLCAEMLYQIDIYKAQLQQLRAETDFIEYTNEVAPIKDLFSIFSDASTAFAGFAFGASKIPAKAPKAKK